MKLEFKPLHEQTIVITGASSGIGLATARLAANHGANVVLAARNESALREATDAIRQQGGEATWVAADIGIEDEVRGIAEVAQKRYGGFDTWVNNAGVTIYGRIMEVPVEDQRRLFDTNYWGLVYGSRVAAEHLQKKGGAIVNIGSVLSEVAFPLQGPYSASKHAVKGFTDALRMELEEAGWPISVTLIKPASIHSYYEDHARSYLEKEVHNPPPSYSPRAVARAILYCATHEKRDMFVGLAGRALAAMGHWAPRTTDRLFERTMIDQQQAERKDYPEARRDNLYEAREDGGERGGYPHWSQPDSAYSEAVMHPMSALGVLAAAAGLGAGLLLLARPKGKRPGERAEAAPPPHGGEPTLPERAYPTPAQQREEMPPGL
ncbi:MAG: SDR family oxidoreductase [Phycisphaeraceae bacterium]